MKLIRHLRPVLLVGALLMAMAPVAANAADAKEEAANRAARCALVLANKKVPGKLTWDQCNAEFKSATVYTAEVRPLAALPGLKCPHPGSPLTAFEKDLINANAIAKAKALKKNILEPATPAEVVALQAC